MIYKQPVIVFNSKIIKSPYDSIITLITLIIDFTHTDRNYFDVTDHTAQLLSYKFKHSVIIT